MPVVKLTYINETSHSLMVEEGRTWLPLSHITLMDKILLDLTFGDKFDCHVPQWLLEDRGLEYLVDD